MHSDNTMKIAFFVGTLIVTWVLSRINRFVFKKIYEKRKLLYLRFFERILTAVIFVSGLFIAISSYGGFQTIWRTMLGGLMISIFKPFEIGNRVELEDGTAGIVRDINMRHVVLQLLDTQVVVIPNSKLNTMSVRNYSYLETYRSALFRFYIGYDSDVEKAIQVIRDAIIASAYSMPAKETDHGNDYAPIYFMAYESSSLRLDTTVYYSPSSPTEVVISDINLRVKHALKENGIEIPYTYLNVVQKQVHE